MGKYKQWLHHQEVGRRLRDQIAKLEQERERVQKMAPAHPTTLPEPDNPLIAALQAYTRQGNIPNRGGDSRPLFGPRRVETDPELPRAVLGDPTPPRVVAEVSGDLGDPVAQLREIARAADADQGKGNAAPASGSADASDTPGADSVSGWWQKYRPQDEA